MLSILRPQDPLARETNETDAHYAMSERPSSSRKLSKHLSGKLSNGSDNGDTLKREDSSSRKRTSLDFSSQEELASQERIDSISSNHTHGISGSSSSNVKEGKDVTKQQKKRRTAKKEKSDGSEKRRKEKTASKTSTNTSNDTTSALNTPVDDNQITTDDTDKKKKRRSADDGKKKKKTSRKQIDGIEAAHLSDGSSQSEGHAEQDDFPVPLPVSQDSGGAASGSSSTSGNLHIDIAYVSDTAGGFSEKRSPTSPKRSLRPMPLQLPSESEDSRSTNREEAARLSARAMPAVPPAPSADDSLDSSQMTSVPPDDDSDEEPMSSWFSSYDDRFPNRLSGDSLGRRRGRSHNRHPRSVAVAPADDARHVALVDFPSSPSKRRTPSRERQSSSDDLAKKQDERIRINVGGRIFETYTGTLRKFPNTLLGTMFHPRNAKLLNLNKQIGAQEDIFFDRNPRVFEVILDFYRTGTVNRPNDITLEMLKEELAFFQIELPEVGITNKRVSMELMKLEYMNIMLPATEYRKMARMKILSDHLNTIVKILDFMQMKIEKKARGGHNSCALTFYSPLHYTNSTPPSIFKVVSTDEIREILIELLEAKGFEVKETNEYSKTKATSIIGLHDQVVNYNDPKFFTFFVRW